MSTYDPTALDKNIPKQFVYLYGPINYSEEIIRLDVKNDDRNFVAYSQKSVKLRYEVIATRIC